MSTHTAAQTPRHHETPSIHNVTTVRQLCAYLDFHGWSTTIPTADETWRAHAWPPLTSRGVMTGAAACLHARLFYRGWLDFMTTDDEGAPCAEIVFKANR